MLTNALGQTADWIELYNTSNSAVNLAGWRLTDDAAKPSKWVFPSWTIPAQGYALVWADNSSLAVTQGELHASFQLSGNGEYLGLYRPNGTVASEYRPAYPNQTASISFGLRPDTGAVFPVTSNTRLRLLIPTNGTLDAVWTGTNFNDSAWASVAQPIGYESSPSNYAALIRTTVPLRTMAAYVRMPFVLDAPATVDELLLRLQFDDGVVIHLNGTALESDNASADAVWNSPALGPRDPEDAVAWTEFDLSGRRDLLVAGTNVLGESDAQPPVAFAPARGFFEQPVTVTLSSPAPGEYVLIVADLAAFRTRYTNWPALRIAGEYQRVYNFPVKTLSDGGEEVRVEDGLGRTLVRFTYGDSRGWPDAADGAGHSLVPLVIDDQTDALDYGGNWRASAFVDGSPGAPDPEPVREVVLTRWWRTPTMTPTRRRWATTPTTRWNCSTREPAR